MGSQADGVASYWADYSTDKIMHKFTYFDRPHGIVCFETDPFDDDSNSNRHAGFVAELLQTKLTWHWQSSRRYASQSPHLNLPEAREWTLLTPNTVPALLDDLRELDASDDGRDISLMGAQHSMMTSLQNATAQQALFKSFAQQVSSHASHIEMMIVQMGDGPNRYLFVPHTPSPAVAQLMAHWHLSASSAATRRPYAQLHLARFEALFGLE